jgi:hypothetical protein
MDMSTRVRAAWAALGAALDGVTVDAPELLDIVQRWLRTTVPAVSKHVRGGGRTPSSWAGLARVAIDGSLAVGE